MDFHQAIPVFSVTVLQVRPPRRASVPCALRLHEIESGTVKKLEGPDPASWSMIEQKLSLG